MITGIYIPTGVPKGPAKYLPVHHYQFQSTCMYYSTKQNMFLLPEIIYKGRFSQCTCYEKIYNTVLRAQLEGTVRPALGAYPELSPADVKHLHALLEKVASANMAERLSHPASRVVWEKDIPAI